MPWSRHDLFFRRNVSLAGRLTSRTKRIGRLAIAGISITTASIAVTTAGQAQTFTPIGPRYSGEVIISERVISPTPERLPAPKRSSSRTSGQTPRQPTLSIAGNEPNSLSDGAEASNLPIADQAPIFALGNDVWKRMLDLERENADLQAQLDYERKLASYIERSETQLINQSEKIAELQEKLKQLQQKGIATSKEKEKALEKAEAQIRQLTARNRDFEQKIKGLQRNLRPTPKPENPNSPLLDRPERKVATKPESQRPKKQRSVKQQAERSTKLERPAPTTLPEPATLPAPVGMPEADKSKKPAKQGQPKNDSKAMLEADEEPVGSVAIAVMPIGFEIPGGTVLLVPSAESEGNETDSEPATEQGLQGGALGPLGKVGTLGQE